MAFLMNADVKKYRRYTKWLAGLPAASEVGEYRSPGSVCDEPVFTIEGRKGHFLLGATGSETEHSVIASLPQGNLLKARVFEPKRLKKD